MPYRNNKPEKKFQNRYKSVNNKSNLEVMMMLLPLQCLMMRAENFNNSEYLPTPMTYQGQNHPQPLNLESSVPNPPISNEAGGGGAGSASIGLGRSAGGAVMSADTVAGGIMGGAAGAAALTGAGGVAGVLAAAGGHVLVDGSAKAIARPVHIPEDQAIQNRELAETVNLSLGELPKFYSKNPGSYNALLQMLGHGGLTEQVQAAAHGSATGLPDSRSVVRSLEEILTFYASVRKYVHSTLENSRRLILKSKAELREVVASTDRLARETDELRYSLQSSKSTVYQTEMKKELLSTLKEVLEVDAELTAIAKWIKEFNVGVSQWL